MTDWMPRTVIIAPATDEEHRAVEVVQRALRLDVTGEMNDATRSALRGFQQLRGLPVTGVLDEATAVQIEALRPPYMRE